MSLFDVKVTIKQNGEGATWRDVHVDGVKVGNVSRHSFGRFGFSAWCLTLTAPNLVVPEDFYGGTLAECRAAVAEIVAEANVARWA